MLTSKVDISWKWLAQKIYLYLYIYFIYTLYLYLYLLTNVTQVFWWQLQEHVLKNIDSNFNTWS